MAKNIIIGVLSALLLLSFLFGLSQKTEAEKQRKLAIAHEARALTAQGEAEKQRVIAEERMAMADASAIEALKQAGIAQEALKNCKGHK